MLLMFDVIILLFDSDPEEVKEQMQRIVLGHDKEAAEAVSAQPVQGVRTK